MKLFTSFALIASMCGSLAVAQDMEIVVPNGWVATDSGIAKGNSELSVGPILDLGELTPAEYLERLAKEPFEYSEITSVSELKDGNIVTQVAREVIKDEIEARSILFICKDGQNKHRLLELFTDDVFAVISGGKAAIGFCSQ
ncbi:hypothetical protein F9L33_08320 [Amylibacter sp. SFDW26]|uniref:hypothetical protein n=1 Tax=Amylibacter sp. SFDW26 TaxID=2652722 RepID=UPI00126149A9|nr:hypothetical protein [Amylibacter sp. SFDW26]KAB7614632.1 hypothetical protein F9L33_08320 [Amylibacter sp. SFDW26]